MKDIDKQIILYYSEISAENEPHNTPKKISKSEMSHKTDIAFAGAGFMGIYHVGSTYCIYLIAPDLLQQRIGGTSAGGTVKKNYFHF